MKAIELFPHVNDFRHRFFPSYRRLSTELIELKPDGTPNSIAFHLRHIAQSEDWFIGIILDEQVQPKRKSELPTIVEIIQYLEDTRAKTVSVLENMDVDKLTTVFTMPEGYRGEKIDNPTFSWLLSRMFDHEIYHLGQVNLTLRLLGQEPPKM